jgi:branched-chain amino acid aminotransferase
LKLAEKKYTSTEGTIALEDIYQAKEAFLTSTTKRIVPIVQINDTLIGDGKPGSVSLSLLNDLIALEQADMGLRK